MKKMTALLLAAAMAVSMTACSPSEKFVESQEAPAADEQAESGSSDGSSSDGLSADTQAFLDSITADNAEAKGVCGTNATWYYKDNVLFIKGEGAMVDFDTDYHTPWWNTEVQEQTHWIIVGEGITTIGNNAFTEFSLLSKVELPNTLSSIGYYAFEKCRNLESITLPDTVTFIGYSAFECCESLEELTIPASVSEIGSDAFLRCAPITITFEGDAPSEFNEYLLNDIAFSSDDSNSVTIQYHGTGFDELIQNYPDYNWVQY